MCQQRRRLGEPLDVAGCREQAVFVDPPPELAEDAASLLAAGLCCRCDGRFRRSRLLGNVEKIA